MKDISVQIEEHYAKKANAVTTTRKDIGDYWETDKIAVNVKSNNVEKENFSPNLVSCKRVYDFLSAHPKNRLKFIFVDYELDSKGNYKVLKDKKVEMEEIDWECLSIQCQGTGVIQRSSELKTRPIIDREDWLNEFRDHYEEYLQRQEQKMNDLRKHFKMDTVERKIEKKKKELEPLKRRLLFSDTMVDFNDPRFSS